VSEPAGDAVAEPLRLPQPAPLFEARAERLRALARDGAAGDFLLLLARVADGQRGAVREIRVAAAAGRGAGPPLDGARAPRDGGWRRMLGLVLAAARAPSLPPEALAALGRLEGAPPERLEALGDAVLAGDVPEEALAEALFVGAALQAWFSAAAATLDPRPLAAGAGAAACPACGSAPVAGVIEGVGRLRYLSCALCATAWHVPRVQCVGCGTDGDLVYLHAEGDRGVKAEACGRCRGYVKLLDQEHRAGAEAAADDAATLALDLVLAEEGWRRLGRNLSLAAAAPPTARA
jgi:FdhE protein